jgi:type II secretory pathway pseudopilin PulG
MKNQGYTLTEVMVASLISVLVIGGVSTSMAHVFRTWRETQVTAELNMGLELAMEHMRDDIRLSSVGVGLMSFYPLDSTVYTAISFPMADDTDGDGMLDRNDEGRIVWTKTVVYHVLGTSPNEFRRTIFSPRSAKATPDALYRQLKTVAKAMSSEAITAAAMDGESCSSRSIFSNLTRLKFYPPSSIFDAYSPTRKSGSTFNFGSVVLNPGVHTLTFAVEGKNDDSSGHNIEIDRFRLGRARGALEGEIFIPANSHPVSPLFRYSVSGGSVSAEDMSAYGVEWSGNAQAKFVASGVGSKLEFSVYNDMWCDSNFDEPGSQISENCSVKWDPSFASSVPYTGDRVVSMDKGIAWSAAVCGDTPYILDITTATTVKNIIYGGSASDDMTICMNGCWTKLAFARPDGYGMNLSGVTISEIGSGDSSAVTFNDGDTSITVPADGAPLIESDWVQLWEIDREKSYAVSFTSTPQGAGLWGLSGWQNNDGVILSVIDGAPAPVAVGIHSLEVGYPKEAIFRSGVFDTHAEDPVFVKLYWTQIERYSEGGDIDIRVRSADNADMSDGDWDAAYWNDDGYFGSNGGNSLFRMKHKRYIQYEAKFQCGRGGVIAAHTNTPTAVLRDVSILWDPPMGLVDLEVDFGMGPDCGIIEATVDGKTFSKSMVVELEIYKKGPRALQTAKAKTEIRPLNTGR